MTFQEFVTYAKDHIKVFLPEAYSDCEVRIKKVDKPSGSYTGLSLDRKGNPISTVYNLDLAYRTLEQDSPAVVVRRMAQSIPEHAPEIDTGLFSKYEEVKKRLFIRASNKAAAKGFLKEAPHLTVGEMAVTYHVLLSQDSEGISSSPINDALLEVLGVDRETLHNDAVENSVRLFPPQLSVLDEQYIRSLFRSGSENEAADIEQVIENLSLESGMLLVLTNDMRLNGAAVMFYPELLGKIADKAGSDLYIIPSSVDEILLMKKDDTISAEMLARGIREINVTEVAPEKILANKPFYYDREAERIISPGSDLSDPEAFYELSGPEDPEEDLEL